MALIHCDICNSDHAAGAYDIGFFITAAGKVLEVHGELEVFHYARGSKDGCGQVFWTEAAVNNELVGRSAAATSFAATAPVVTAVTLDTVSK